MKKKKPKVIYYIGDVLPNEINIERLEDSEFEPDGEFAFASLKECKEYCLNQIDQEIKELQRTRAGVLKVKK